jgi:hypothetical protein
MTESHNSFTEQETDFTMVRNELIRSPNLSCKAFKLLCIGLSHEKSWVFRKSQIATCFKEGEHTLDAAMKELRSEGYLHLTAKLGEDKKFDGHNWYWCKTPRTEEEFKLFLREGGFHGLGETRGSENPCDIRRSRFKNTNLNKNNNRKKKEVVVPSCLKKLKLEKGYLMEISSKLSQEDAELLCLRLDRWKGRGVDIVSCRTILSQWDTWDDSSSKESKEDQLKANREAAIDLFGEKREIPFTSKENATVSVYVADIEFLFNTKSYLFEYSDKKFVENVNKFLDRTVFKKRLKT